MTLRRSGIAPVTDPEEIEKFYRRLAEIRKERAGLQSEARKDETPHPKKGERTMTLSVADKIEIMKFAVECAKWTFRAEAGEKGADLRDQIKDNYNQIITLIET